MKTILLFCLLLLPFRLEARTVVTQDSLFQLVNYIQVDSDNREAFENNMLLDRKGLAQATVDEGIVESWHFFRNIDENVGDYLQVITLTKDQKENTALAVEVEAVASRVLGDKKSEVLSTGTSLIAGMEEEWWFEIERMWTEDPMEKFEYMMIGYMQSIPADSKEYQSMEREVWQPAIKHGMDKGLLTGWTMANIGPGHTVKDYNYVAIDAFDNQAEMTSVDWNGWLSAAHKTDDVAKLNERTESTRAFIRSSFYKLIDWAGKK